MVGLCPPLPIVRRAFITSMLLVVLIGLLVATHATDAGLDRPVADYVRDHIDASTRDSLYGGTLSWLGDEAPRTVLVLVGFVALLAWRAWWDAALLLTGFAAGLGLVRFLKDLLHRTRPSGEADSFPSGHAALIVIVWGLVALLLWDAWRRRHPRPEGRPPVGEGLTIGVVLLAILVVGAARVLAGLHYPMDVLGGWALGATVVSGTAWVQLRGPEWWRQRRTSRAPQSA